MIFPIAAVVSLLPLLAICHRHRPDQHETTVIFQPNEQDRAAFRFYALATKGMLIRDIQSVIDLCARVHESWCDFGEDRQSLTDFANVFKNHEDKWMRRGTSTHEEKIKKYKTQCTNNFKDKSKLEKFLSMRGNHVSKVHLESYFQIISRYLGLVPTTFEAFSIEVDDMKNDPQHTGGIILSDSDIQYLSTTHRHQYLQGLKVRVMEKSEQQPEQHQTNVVDLRERDLIGFSTELFRFFLSVAQFATAWVFAMPIALIALAFSLAYAGILFVLGGFVGAVGAGIRCGFGCCAATCNCFTCGCCKACTKPCTGADAFTSPIFYPAKAGVTCSKLGCGKLAVDMSLKVLKSLPAWSIAGFNGMACIKHDKRG